MIIETQSNALSSMFFTVVKWHFECVFQSVSTLWKILFLGFAVGAKCMTIWRSVMGLVGERGRSRAVTPENSIVLIWLVLKYNCLSVALAISSRRAGGRMLVDLFV